MASQRHQVADPPPSVAAQTVTTDFRMAMRRLAATVSIITCSTSDGPIGMTMTSVTSVAMDPPTLLICVNRATRLGASLAVGGLFCVNLLHASQQAEAAAFGGSVSGEERFGIGRWHIEEGQPPCLEDAQANIFCSVEGGAAVGTHTVVVGRVQGVRLTGEVAPLLYTDGRYAALTAGTVGF